MLMSGQHEVDRNTRYPRLPALPQGQHVAYLDHPAGNSPTRDGGNVGL